MPAASHPITSSSWELLPTKIPKGASYCSVSLGATPGKIVLVSGFCYVFHAHTQTWEKLVTTMSSPLQRCAAVFHRDTLYVMGGSGTNSMESIRLDHRDASSWNKLPPMITNRRYFCAVPMGNGKIIVIGGEDKGSCLQHVEMFDTDKQTWNRLPNMLEHRSACAAVVMDHKLYVFGGYNGTHYLDTAEVLDLASNNNVFERLPDLPRRCGGGAAVVVGQHVLLIGGVNDTKVMDAVDCFNSVEAEWEQVRPLLTPRTLCGAVRIGHHVHVLGGQDENGKTLQSVETITVEKFLPKPPSLPCPPNDLGRRRRGTALRNWVKQVQTIKQSYLDVMESEVSLLQGQHDERRRKLDKTIQKLERAKEDLRLKLCTQKAELDAVKNNWLAGVDDQLHDAEEQIAFLSKTPKKGQCSYESPPPQLLCPISHELMDDPVVAADGHTYNRNAIQRWFSLAPPGHELRSPLTNVVLEHCMVLPNLAIRSQVVDYQER